MGAIIVFFAAAFLIGFLFVQMKQRESLINAVSRNDFENLRKDYAEMQRRIEIIEAIVIDEDSTAIRPNVSALDDVDPVEPRNRSRQR